MSMSTRSGRLGDRETNSLLRRARRAHLEAGVREDVPHQLEVERVVLHHEDDGAHARSVSAHCPVEPACRRICAISDARNSALCPR